MFCYYTITYRILHKAFIVKNSRKLFVSFSITLTSLAPSLPPFISPEQSHPSRRPSPLISLRLERWLLRRWWGAPARRSARALRRSARSWSGTDRHWISPRWLSRSWNGICATLRQVRDPRWWCWRVEEVVQSCDTWDREETAGPPSSSWWRS